MPNRIFFETRRPTITHITYFNVDTRNHNAISCRLTAVYYDNMQELYRLYCTCTLCRTDVSYYVTVINVKNVNVRNCSLYTLLTATDRKQLNHKKAICTTIKLPECQCYYLRRRRRLCFWFGLFVCLSVGLLANL